MNVYRDLAALPNFRNTVVTIGSYDGVHSGHQTILAQVNDLAQSIGGESVLVTFHPHPRLVLNPDNASIKLITTIDEKIDLLAKYAVNHLVIAPFTKAFSRQTPDEYIQHFLVDKIHPKKIVIGYDHRFGNRRAGNIEYLRKFEQQFDYEVQEIEKQAVDDIVVSSTKIRNSILTGDIQTATALLNHPFTVSGKVMRGKQIGRTIGFPTANVAVENPHKIIPADGVYAARIFYDNKTYTSMLYIGHSLDNEYKTLEVNIFDFDENIYDKHLTVEFVARVRGDIRFGGVEALKTQLAEDKRNVMQLFEKK